MTYLEFVDLRFAPDGVLTGLENAVTDDSGCTNSGICTALWPCALALYAEPDSREHLDQATPDLCAVYAYLGAGNLAPAFAVQLGADQVAMWVQEGDFVTAVVQPGTRRFWAITQNELMDSLRWSAEESGWSDKAVAAAPWVSLDVDCGPGEVRYFELIYARDGRQQILEVDDARGEQERATRRQLISTYSGEFPFVQPVTPAMEP